MAESEPRPERVASTETGRHSHKRRARKRRAGEAAGALSDGSFEQKLARWTTLIIGVALYVGQLVVTRVVVPTEVFRGLMIIIGVTALAILIVWLDRLRSKKRNPKPRWLRGILVAGFLCLSVVIGALIVLTMTANPIEEGSFTAIDAGQAGFSDRYHFESKTAQLKLFVFHIIMTVSGLAMVAHGLGTERSRRAASDAARFKASSPR